MRSVFFAAPWILFLLAVMMIPALASDAQKEKAVPGTPTIPVFPEGEDAILPGLVDVQARIPDVVADLKYATTDNFMKKNVYGGLKRCFLVEEAVQKLEKARARLKERAPELTFVLWDCARPKRVQLVMWDMVKGTPSQSYVANPHTRTGSIHNYGCAIDMSLYDTVKKAPVDMGTPYDYFGRLAEPRHELNFWKSGKLSSEQLSNRLLLREVMMRTGFHILRNEWWHFNCFDNSTVRKNYKQIP
jgi:D-alanyl-D-alanine dipeptidase